MLLTHLSYLEDLFENNSLSKLKIASDRVRERVKCDRKGFSPMVVLCVRVLPHPFLPFAANYCFILCTKQERLVRARKERDLVRVRNQHEEEFLMSPEESHFSLINSSFQLFVDFCSSLFLSASFKV